MIVAMPNSVFTLVRLGELPGEILYQDEYCFVILSVRPHNPGHLLVIPIDEVSNWEDLEPALFDHLMKVAQFFAKAIKAVYHPPKVGLASVGFEVPHAHIHVYSLFKIGDIDHTSAKASQTEELAIEAEKIKNYITSLGGVKL
ncbi:HIT family protein [Candidatus Saccharibacteria bacterium]|nr:HIT family protein [Candidatus Saccharibacteria bacterium]